MIVSLIWSSVSSFFFSPDTASYVQKLEREKEAKERGEVKDNRSFLAKYVSVTVMIKMWHNFDHFSGCTLFRLLS